MSELRELSIHEMNKLRASIGLAPLVVEDQPKPNSKNQSTIETEPIQSVQDKLRKVKEKHMDRKRSREIKKRFPTLGDADSEDDLNPLSWVEKSRQISQNQSKIDQQKQKDKEKKKEKAKTDGLKVKHNYEDIIGKEIVFTLKDEPILIGNDKINDTEDVLENIDLVELGIAKRNMEIKNPKSIYDFDEKETSLLSKYDEVETEKGFFIGDKDFLKTKKNFKRKSNKANEEANFEIEDESFVVGGSDTTSKVMNNDDEAFTSLNKRPKIRKTREEDLLKRVEETKKRKKLEESEDKDVILFTPVDEFLSSIPLPDEIAEETKKQKNVEHMETEEVVKDVAFDKKDEEFVSSLYEKDRQVGKGVGSTLSMLKMNPILDGEDELFSGRANDKKDIIMGSPSVSYEDIASQYHKEIKIESYDEFGRKRTTKERFRDFAQKFHGTKPGINKTEKRLRKMKEEQERIKRQSSESTLEKLESIQKAQKEQNKPFIVLGSKPNK